jgi:hypothetical protein
MPGVSAVAEIKGDVAVAVVVASHASAVGGSRMVQIMPYRHALYRNIAEC